MGRYANWPYLTGKKREQCKALTSFGQQCRLSRQEGYEYCGGHIKRRAHGTVDAMQESA